MHPSGKTDCRLTGCPWGKFGRGWEGWLVGCSGVIIILYPGMVLESFRSLSSLCLGVVLGAEAGSSVAGGREIAGRAGDKLGLGGLLGAVVFLRTNPEPRPLGHWPVSLWAVHAF